MTNSWIENRVKYIEGLKKPSEQQELIALLYKLPNRTPQQERKLAALVRAEKAAERALHAKLMVTKLLNEEKRKTAADERKKRTRRLIQLGALVDLAGLEGKSRGEVLGLLLVGAKIEDQEKWAGWKRQGDDLLANLEKQRPVSPNSTPS